MIINRLQLAKGGKEYLSNLKAARATNFVEVDFATHAASMGAETETVTSTSELEGAAYWESPTLELPTTKENKKALEEHRAGKSKQRQGV